MKLFTSLRGLAFFFLGQYICLGYPSGNKKVQFTLRCKIQAYT